jgi:uroporphyrinogen decarboxylase
VNDIFLRAARREKTEYTPIWLLRQAGRYLPEYRALREKYSLLDIAKTPELAVKATLQPVKRLHVDAAILFADIMLPLEGMGTELEIQESLGPVIRNPVQNAADVARLRVGEPEEDTRYVLEAIRILRRELADQVPLIGFAGAPFTLASYLIEGRASRDFAKTKMLMYREPAIWHALMEKLSETVARYLEAQINAGAQAVQLFDSWAGALSPRDYRDYVLPFSKMIMRALASHGVPRIHFGVNTSTLLELMKTAGGEVIGVDWRLPLLEARRRLGRVGYQGNLDPAVLLGDVEIIREQAKEVLDAWGPRVGHIFNLGHGVLPNTPVENVQALVDFVHEYSPSCRRPGFEWLERDDWVEILHAPK